jgi:hypothetical protein
MDIVYLTIFFGFAAIFLVLGAWKRNQLLFFIGAVFLAFCGLFSLGSGLQFPVGSNTSYGGGYSIYTNNTFNCSNAQPELGGGCDSNTTITGSETVMTIFVDLNKDYSMGLAIILFMVSFYLMYQAFQSWRSDDQIS